MKKTLSIIFTALCLCLVTSVSAQDVFFTAGVGYAGASGGWLLDNTTITDDAVTYETVNVSFGKGLNIGATGGVMFNENVGIQLGINYLLGGKSTVTMDDQPSESSSEMTYQGRMLRVVPSVIISAEEDDITPYARFGAVLGFGSYDERTESTSTFANVKTTSVMNENYSGGTAFGWHGAFGLMFELSKQMSLFTEIQHVNLTYRPTMSVVDEATVDGENQLDDMTTSQKEYEYVDKLTENFSDPIDDSKPTQFTKFSTPWSSFGLNVGIKINVGR
jgi:hypothetical protein